ncbi:LysR family transcriptional regulator [Caballeronia sp. LP006]|jgi:DNA-binding transcriptional LysR family regulator|uniref:LysR family transcriptional regulator n=1 Tax=unclassified Caballeronia TaxID=2646786 RepID=UPI0020276CE4|nr:MULTISPECIES: LysR family transcriptional regulator [unclassified Caballeronia]MDR5776209.1 LysR family transcriptional regulator [Caballeronia sp. LZ002]MDR5801124.1 LysR family transcriptional regulator [Caballeronia sp. LZ001]MDR5829315.1 LysR family transcriptional regulator [Caballeronia sp. LP006]MDR5851649.1 LysR family transcriptional regulator [Caballeronia sp. LZ003]
MAGFNERILNGISVFAAIVDAGTFAAAGNRLGMSQPGVSRAIARLEARLRVRLFDRTTRSVSLTDDGRRFFEQVMPHLNGLEEAAATASGGATAVRGRLRVNVDPIFSRLVLGPKLYAFMDAHPEIELELITSDRLGDMIADGFDLAIRFGEPRDSSLVARKLLDTPVRTVAAPSYIARCGRPATPQALESDAHTCVEFRDPETGRPFVWEFHRKKKRMTVDTRGRLTLNDVGTMLSASLSGYCVAQILELGSEHLFTEGKLIDLFPDWPDERFPLYAYYPSRHHPPAKTRAFLDLVISLAQTK